MKLVFFSVLLNLVFGSLCLAEHEIIDAALTSGPTEEISFNDLGLNYEGPASCAKYQWDMNDATQSGLRGFKGTVRLVGRQSKSGCTISVIDIKSGEKKASVFMSQLGAATAAPTLLTQIRKAYPAGAAAETAEGCLKSDERSQRWTEKQLSVAEKTFDGENGGLLDTTKFLSPKADAAVKAVVGQRFDGRGKSFAVTRPLSREYKYAIEVTSGGEASKWFIAEQPWYRDQYPNGPPRNNFVIYKEGENNMVQANLDKDAIADGKINFASVSRAMEQAEASRASELADATRISKWDLPKGPMGYIGLIDSHYDRDPVIGGMVEDVRNFPRMMNEMKKACSFVANNGSDFIVVKKSPKDILIDQVGKLAEKGLTTAYLNLAGHGNKEGIYFANPSGGYYKLTPTDLAEVINSQPDMKFVVNTVACLGGGMAEMMKTFDREIKGDPNRVRLFLQAKLEGVNQEGRIQGTSSSANGAPEAFSSYYQVFLTHFLNQGKNYGDAHLFADRAAKRIVPSDAEVWAPGASTKGLK